MIEFFPNFIKKLPKSIRIKTILIIVNIPYPIGANLCTIGQPPR